MAQSARDHWKRAASNTPCKVTACQRESHREQVYVILGKASGRRS